MEKIAFKPQRDTLLIHALADGVTVLGPGKRYTIWVQGCNRRCVGCISESSRFFFGGERHKTEELAAAVLASDAEGLTLSGGEPMLQAEALAYLIRTVRARNDLGVVLYTGFVYEELVKGGTEAQKELLSLCDVVIDGEYVIELDDGKPHRGSSNQRILFLSDRYAAEREGYYSLEGERKSEMRRVSEDEILSIGLPKPIPLGTDGLGNIFK